MLMMKDFETDLEHNPLEESIISDCSISSVESKIKRSQKKKQFSCPFKVTKKTFEQLFIILAIIGVFLVGNYLYSIKKENNLLNEELSTLKKEQNDFLTALDVVPLSKNGDDKSLSNEYDQNEHIQKLKKIVREIEGLNSKITKLNSEKKDLSKKLIDQKSLVKSILNSEILKSTDEYFQLKKMIDPNNDISLALLYSTKYHGDDRDAFRTHVGNTERTVILIETTEGVRFGGYTRKDWSPLASVLALFGVKYFKKDTDSFLFNLNSGKKFKLKEKEKAIYSDKKHFLGFGNGDIVIKNKYKSKECQSFFPRSYGKEGKDTVKDLAGGEKFNVKSIEIFGVKIFD